MAAHVVDLAAHVEEHDARLADVVLDPGGVDQRLGSLGHSSHGGHGGQAKHYAGDEKNDQLSHVRSLLVLPFALSLRGYDQVGL